MKTPAVIALSCGTIALATFIAWVFTPLCCVAPDVVERPVMLGAITTVSTPTGVGTSPMFALSPKGKRAMVWVSAPDSGTDGRLHVSVNGATPVTIADPLGAVQAHGEAPPRMMFGQDGSIAILYVLGKDVEKRFPASALRFVRSADGGTTWSTPTTVTDDSTTFGSHNFHSLYVALDGTIYAAWLDGRTGTSGTYFTYSKDGGRTWAPNKKLSVGETCPCCRTAITADAQGVVYAAWRTVLTGNVRDIVVARSMDYGATWSAPVRVHADDWIYPGCPHAGPSMQIDALGRVHVLWWTGAQRGAGVYYAISSDEGKSFATPAALYTQQTPVPSHVQLALDGDHVVATWDVMRPHGAVVTARISRDGGLTFGDPLVLSDTTASAQYPVVGVDANKAYVAWSQTAGQDAPTATEMAPMNPAAHGGGGHKMGLHPVGATQVLLREVRL
jgi:hypothetical protein